MTSRLLRPSALRRSAQAWVRGGARGRGTGKCCGPGQPRDGPRCVIVMRVGGGHRTLMFEQFFREEFPRLVPMLHAVCGTGSGPRTSPRTPRRRRSETGPCRRPRQAGRLGRVGDVERLVERSAASTRGVGRPAPRRRRRTGQRAKYQRRRVVAARAAAARGTALGGRPSLRGGPLNRRHRRGPALLAGRRQNRLSPARAMLARQLGQSTQEAS